MSIGIVDLLFSASIAVLATLAAWFGRQASLLSRRAKSESGSDFQQAEAILGRLRDLAAGVAADVDEHSLQVEAINHQLSAENGSDAAVVVKAVSQLVAANDQMQRQLDSAQQQLRQQAEEIKCQTAAARTDALTGLANRRVFDDEIAEHARRFAEQGDPFAVTILDIDHFKKFNDTHGHQIGDLVLQHAAKVYLAAAAETDIVTRFGGEEFAVIHPRTTNKEAALRADALRRALDDSRICADGKELHVTASLGVAEVAPNEDPEKLLKRADAALYAAKEAGRNRTFSHNGATPQPFVMPAGGYAFDRSALLQGNLLNRPEFLAKLATAILPTAFLVQADRFDDYQQRYGEDTGEHLLGAVATVLLAVARKHGAVARFDSKTFAVLVSGYDSVQAVTIAEQIRRLSQQCPLPTPSGSIEFTLSIGASQPADGDGAASVVARAETALDTALRAGGDCTFFHDGTQPQPAENILSEADCTA